MTNKDLIKKINSLKNEKNALILVHNYQLPEIYEVADFIGDSLDLCIKASNTDKDIIVFAGVHFMAESAAILNPGKTVLIPDKDAGCAMADMLTPKILDELQKKHPDALTVCYVNTTAEIKAMCDACCTSANAVNVVKALPAEKIIFVPDSNLANHVKKHAPGKTIISNPGYCPIHHFVDFKYLEEVKESYPEAKIIAHPESRVEILNAADIIASTSGMIEAAKKSEADEFFVLTECGMIERLKKEVPGKKFFGLCNLCFDMKKNNLESIYNSLKNELYEVKVDQKIVEKAKKAFDKMFELTN